MKLKAAGILAVIGLVAGCTAITQSGATVSDGVIHNPSLGFFGFSFRIPEEVALYDPEAGGGGDSELQQMAVRIYELNESYHPSGNEVFYESFLMRSEQTAFLLVTVTQDRLMPADSEWDSDDLALARRLLPMFNVSDSARTQLGENRLDALMLKGRAFEKDGWYYSRPKSGRTEFVYEACRVQGVNRDRYILMGFCLPGYEHILSIQMQEMVRGFAF